MKIVEPILFQCKLNPLALAIYVPGSKYGAINYATLERYIHNVAQTALKSGIAARNVVAIYVTDPILHITHIRLDASWRDDPLAQRTKANRRNHPGCDSY